MAGTNLKQFTNMEEKLVRKACSLAMKAHKSPEKPFVMKRSCSSSKVLISFPGSWFVNGWFAGNSSFGETKINKELFPSLRSIGNDEVAVVNQAFLQRFEEILGKLKIAVDKIAKDKKKIIFTGHSSGGAIAMLATIWLLEEIRKSKTKHDPPLCVTFGSPLLGNFIFSHSLRRENWSSYFINFITRYDVVPRIHLSPLASLEEELQPILNFFNPKSSSSEPESVVGPKKALDFVMTLMSNASAIASYDACNLMGNTNGLLDTMSSFVELSPYRPFGTYIFCTVNKKFVVLMNPDAVLQILFFSSQLTSFESEGQEISYNSLKDHRIYNNLVSKSLELPKVVCLSKLEYLSLSSDGAVGCDAATVTAMDGLGLSSRARLNLCAAGVMENIKKSKEHEINEKKDDIVKLLDWLEDYRDAKAAKNLGYYDAFKLQTEEVDFNANIKRLQLAAIWDKIIEMLKKYELPDGFEGQEDWIKLGTRFRRILEPLDIANFYRHSKDSDAGPYFGDKGRPKRYRYTQRWREHALKMTELSDESIFWAEVEELLIRNSDNASFERIKERVLELEAKLKKWYEKNEIGNDVFLSNSTFMKWWIALPEYHRTGSCIATIVKEQ